MLWFSIWTHLSVNTELTVICIQISQDLIQQHMLSMCKALNKTPNTPHPRAKFAVTKLVHIPKFPTYIKVF